MFDLAGDIDLESQSLQPILSGTRTSSTSGQAATPGATAGSIHSEMKGCESTEGGWNM